MHLTPMDNFQARAQAAASAITSKNPAEAFAQSLTNDRPTIDSAVKSYMSLTSARGAFSHLPTTSSAMDQIHNALGSSAKTGRKEQCFFVKSKNGKMASLFCARTILKKINSFQIPEAPDASKDEAKEIEFHVIRILWNGLVKNGQKPSMILGRHSLSQIYPIILQALIDDIPDGVDDEEGQTFMEEFGNLLIDGMKQKNSSIPANEREKLNQGDNDSCLLWDIDGGKEELQRRRDKRKKKSKAANESLNGPGDFESSKDVLTIEEIVEGDEEVEDA
jgi:hypothetical protein